MTRNELFPDPLFVEPYVDVDEWRDEPLRHRYVHGGFTSTDLRFSMYFPAEGYDGRFVQPLMHIAGNENVAVTGELAGLGNHAIQFAFDFGGYLVESNMGSTMMMGPADITGFRASAATAQYSRVLAEEMYGDTHGEHRPYGYVTGGSGGAYKTMACYENAPGVWDGAVPFIHGSHQSMPNVFTVQAHAFRVLDGVFDQIVDSVEPGGGDMYEGLGDEQRAALEEVTRMGFPPRAWFAHERVALSYTGVFAAIFGTLAAGDPGYFEDFWTLPGYLGADPPASLVEARIQSTTTVAALVSTAEVRDMGLPVSITAGTRDSAPAALRFAELPADLAEGRLQGAFLTPTSGAAAGQRLMITGVLDGLVMLGFGGMSIPVLETIQVGDTVEIDNSDYLAAQTYHRHQDPGPEYSVWDQFKAADGSHLYPVRPLLRGLRPGGRRQLLAERQVRLQGDLGQLPDGRGRVPVAGRLVPAAGDRQLRARLPRPLPPLVRRPGDAREPESLPVAQRGLRATTRPRTRPTPRSSAIRACCTRRCAMWRPGSSAASNLPARRVTDSSTGRSRCLRPPPSAVVCNRSSRSASTVVSAPTWRSACPSSSSATSRCPPVPAWSCPPSGTTTDPGPTTTSSTSPGAPASNGSCAGTASTSPAPGS